MPIAHLILLKILIGMIQSFIVISKMIQVFFLSVRYDPIQVRSSLCQKIVAGKGAPYCRDRAKIMHCL